MIILLGFPKSGTRSFTLLFEKLGMCSHVYHWKKDNEYIGKIINDNKINKKLLLDGFEKDDCITQLDVCTSEELNFWPQITDFKKLYSSSLSRSIGVLVLIENFLAKASTLDMYIFCPL